MGLYLTIFSDEEELAGLEIGSYSDYAKFIDFLVENVEGGNRGSKCPTLTLHHDSDGEWSSLESVQLLSELKYIKEKLIKLPPYNTGIEWMNLLFKENSMKPNNAYESFLDVDGEYLLERLIDLTCQSIELKLPILFQ